MRALRDTPPRAARVRHRAHLEVASHRVTNHRWKRRLPVGDVFVPLPTTPRVWPAGQPAGDHRSTRAPAALHQTTTHIPSGYPGLCLWPSGDATLPRYVTGYVQRRQLQRASDRHNARDATRRPWPGRPAHMGSWPAPAASVRATRHGETTPSTRSELRTRALRSPTADRRARHGRTRLLRQQTRPLARRGS